MEWGFDKNHSTGGFLKRNPLPVHAQNPEGPSLRTSRKIGTPKMGGLPPNMGFSRFIVLDIPVIGHVLSEILAWDYWLGLKEAVHFCSGPSIDLVRKVNGFLRF